MALGKEFMQIVYGTNAGAMEYAEELAALQKTYTAGLMEWRKGEASYPDANFTMRLTWGHVMSYSPKDAVLYRHYTTLDGVMEKEDPDNWEFVVPAKLKEIWKNADYGDYAMENGKMPTCFLSNNDITGGNSGSLNINRTTCRFDILRHLFCDLFVFTYQMSRMTKFMALCMPQEIE